MPNTRRGRNCTAGGGKGKTILTKQAESKSATTVANDNKNGRRRTRSAPGKTVEVKDAKRKKLEARNVNEDQMSRKSESPKRGGAPAKSTGSIEKRKVSKDVDSHPKVTEVNFAEDDCFMSMEVDQIEDQYGNSDDEVDYADEENEISFRNTSNFTGESADEYEDEEPNSDNSSEGEPDEDDQIESGDDKSVSGAANVGQTNQDHIKELDKEMQVRLPELHALMKQEGLDQSVEEFEGNLDVTPKGMHKSLNKNENSNVKKKTRFADKTNRTVESQSEEMIYKDAVLARNDRKSSSSDDIDTSDELLQFELDGMNIFTGSPVSGQSTNCNPVREQ